MSSLEHSIQETVARVRADIVEKQLPSVRPDILKAAVAKYGQSAQVDMAIEEMSELTKALCKERRTQLIQGKHAEAVSNIVEEIADVAIMLWQLMLMFDCDGEVQRQVDFKTTRLAQRLAADGGAIMAKTARYIDANDLHEKLQEAGGCDADKNSWDDGYDKAIAEAIRLLDETPTADVVEATRCEKCAYYHHEKGGWCERHDFEFDVGDFCCHGTPAREVMEAKK